MTHRVAMVVPAAAIVIAACTAAPGDAPVPPAPSWALAPTVELEVRDDGAPGHDLYQVRAARSLADGGVLVLNGGSFEVRRFDREGHLVSTIGRPGEGPGEFRWPIDLQLLGDTVVVYDLILRRLSRFDLDGNLLGELSLAEASWATPGVALQLVLGGDLLAIDLAEGAPIDPVTHLRRMPYLVVRHRADAGITDSLGEGGWPGAPFLIQTADGGERAWLLPFGTTTAAAATAAHTFVGTSDRYRILVFGRDGTALGEIRDPRPGRPVDDALAGAMIDWLVATGSAANAGATRSALTDAALPTTVPAFGELLADDTGLLWVAPYWLPGEAVRSWDVWGADGVRRATVEVPASLQLLSIGPDAVLGVIRDGDGQERVVRHHLEREAAPGR